MCAAVAYGKNTMIKILKKYGANDEDLILCDKSTFEDIRENSKKPVTSKSLQKFLDEMAQEKGYSEPEE